MERSNCTEMGYNGHCECDCFDIYSNSRAQEIADSWKDRVLNKGVECPFCSHNIGCFDLYMLEGKIVSDPIVCENCSNRVRLRDNFWECELC